MRCIHQRTRRLNGKARDVAPVFSRGMTVPELKGFTLLELLVVTAIIGLLAALLLPVLARVRIKAQVQMARTEIETIVSSIHEYESAYSQFPISVEALKVAAAQGEDMTFGAVIEETKVWIAGPGNYLTNNCELMAVLLDLESYGDGTPTINQYHRRNLRREKFLQARMRGGTNALPGVGIDGVYRDPWGSPYLVTLDLNHDGRARDCFYRDPAVSQDPLNPNRGLNGLVQSIDSKSNTVFEVTAPVVVWSAGPDRHINQSEKADRGVNRDNLLSWAR